MNFKFKKAYNPAVFYPSIIVLFIVLSICLIFPTSTLKNLKAIQSYLTTNFGWFYVLSVALIFFSMLFLMISRFGNIKLGSDHSKPEYSNLAWFAMLFAAGMGIGLMFFGVGEPLMHYLAPPSADPQTIEAAKQAMKLTFFHWGFNAWSVYGIVAIILAYFAYRHNLPLTLRSAFYPIVGDKIYGRFGDVIDILAVIATLFGVTTSLGYGVLQINAGFNYLFGIEMTTNIQIITILIITVFVTISATSGVNKGIKILSLSNIFLAFLFVAFIFVLGNTTGLLKSLVENTGNYLTSFIGDNFNLFAYEKKNENWLGGWTLLYWTWWLSWSPFVGLFIAKISRGRTIREFVVGVLLVPSGFTFLWMTAFGNSAIELVNEGFTRLADVTNEDVSLALFVFLEKFPLTSVLSGISVLMICLFFITSADSSAMVIDMLCSRGKDRTPVWQKIFWCVLIGIIAAVLLYTGGLDALQTMTIISALPLSIALLGCMYGLFKALRVDYEKGYTRSIFNLPTGLTSSKRWQDRLKNIIDTPNKDDARDFLLEVAEPAFNEVCDEFIKNGLKARIEKIGINGKINIHVGMGEDTDFIYGVKIIKTQTPDYAMNDNYYRAEVYLFEGGQDYDVIGWSKEALINDVIDQYHKHMYFLHKTNS